MVFSRLNKRGFFLWYTCLGLLEVHWPAVLLRHLTQACVGSSSGYCSKLQVTIPAAEMGLDALTCFSAAAICIPAVHVHCNKFFNWVIRDAVGCEPVADAACSSPLQQESQQAGETCTLTTKSSKGVSPGQSRDGRGEPASKAVTDLCNRDQTRDGNAKKMTQKINPTLVTGFYMCDWTCLQDNF